MIQKILFFSLLSISLLNAANINLNKTTYLKTEKVIVNFTNMSGKNKDWIGIYPKGSSNAWANVVAWHWTDDKSNGQLTFNALPTGTYEARAFYNNSFTLESKKEFSVKKANNEPSKIVYKDAEDGIDPR